MEMRLGNVKIGVLSGGTDNGHPRRNVFQTLCMMVIEMFDYLHAANLCASCKDLMTLAYMRKNGIPTKQDGTRLCRARNIYVRPEFVSCR